MTSEVQLVPHPFRRHSLTRHIEGSALNLVSSAKPAFTPPRREKIRMVSRRSTPVYSPQKPLLDCESTVDSQVNVEELVTEEVAFADLPSADLTTGITDEALRHHELVEEGSTESDDDQTVSSCQTNARFKVLQFAQPTTIIETFISYQPKVVLSPARSPTRTLTSRTKAFRPGQSPVDGKMTAQHIALYTPEEMGTDKNNEIEYEKLTFEVVNVKENILRLEIRAL